MYLFFDTETTGLPKNFNAPETDVDNWPRMVQLAYVAYETEADLISEANYIIRPNGFTIPKQASDVHGIITERAIREGTSLDRVLDDFDYLVKQANYLVAHNINFDKKIVGAEMIRSGMENSVYWKKKICTMRSSTSYCGIKNARGGTKWPKLSELHIKLFGEDFEDAHDALADIRATARCFWELKKLGIIT